MTQQARQADRAETFRLFLRSLLWAVLLPGLVAGYLPWRYFGLKQVRFLPTSLLHLTAVGILLLGAFLLGTCILEFTRSGRGTLSPVDPPRVLVVRGLYRYVRNPMYLSVALILAGELLLTQSRALLLFAASWFATVNVFVLGYEEPRLRRHFGGAYEDYCRQVRRWIPSLVRRPSGPPPTPRPSPPPPPAP